MNGLEQILLKIEEDNNLEIKKILDDGKSKADAYVSEIKSKAETEAAAIKASAEKKAALMIENAKSGCESYIKREELAAKSEIVSDCISSAGAQIKSMDQDRYFESIVALIMKYAHEGEGELMMNSRDIERMPRGFLKKVNAELKKSGSSLVLSDTPADIDSGFIIRYGGIEENCTFDALIEDKIDEIKDKLYGQLNA